MDLNVGDTFDISNIRLFPGTFPDSFNIVDSIKYINNLKHIYFKGIYKQYDEPYTLIEGVGSNMSIFWKYVIQPAIPFSGGYYLLCSYKSGIKTGYENRAFNGICWLYTHAKKLQNSAANITIFPQPANDFVGINNNTYHKINRIKVISQTGKIVKEITAPEITRLEIGELPTGYYFLTMYTGDGYIINKPMIVQ
jgi:hypothetical protein